MSFIYSRALVEAYSQANCSDTRSCALLSGSHTPPLFLPSDKTTDFSRLSRFGMTFGHLMDDLGADVLTWWLEASRAKTSASPEKAQGSPESAPVCGHTWRGSLAKFDPVTSSWKTAQRSLLEDSGSPSVTWPRSGMTADGQCWELPMLERRTSAIGSGLWPTPVANDTSSRSKPYAQGGTPLSLAVKWPTPTAHNAKEGAHPSEYERNCPTLATHAGGPLNPMWVEWLMGWPLGWTDLKPLAMDKSHSAPLKHGESLLETCNE